MPRYTGELFTLPKAPVKDVRRIQGFAFRLPFWFLRKWFTYCQRSPPTKNVHSSFVGWNRRAQYTILYVLLPVMFSAIPSFYKIIKNKLQCTKNRQEPRPDEFRDERNVISWCRPKLDDVKSSQCSVHPWHPFLQTERKQWRPYLSPT